MSVMILHTPERRYHRVRWQRLRCRKHNVWPAGMSAGHFGPIAVFAILVLASTVLAQDRRLIDRDDYADRLRAMWLGEIIANWTGLRAEGKRTEPPFLTDDDWGIDLGKGPLEFVTDQDPWKADDDTDIEYVYLHLMDQHKSGIGATLLSAEQIADGWIAHINRFIWVSNARARELMDRGGEGGGVVPPETGLGSANTHWLKIDAQLTTEFFGALAPGMPDRAMELAELPIAVTASGHAAHAAQFYVVLYSLATQVDPALAPPDRNVWLVTEARRSIPDTSKAADIVDFVLADYLANPDPDDWELTRDRVYERYQLNASANGFKYWGWTESSINFATGLIALLYGEGDYKRTIQIGTLSGWDADNGTATMGGLLGLMLGTDELIAQFPGQTLSDRFWISRTRDNMTDYLPDDPEAEDTFSLMAGRMVPIIERVIGQAGGLLDDEDGLWLLPPVPSADPLDLNPSQRLWNRSANNRVRLEGGTVSASSSVASNPPSGFDTGYGDPAHFANGFQHDFSGADVLNSIPRRFYSTLGAGGQPGDTQFLTVEYDRPVPIHTIRLIEGEHLDQPGARGGWFDTLWAQVRVGGQWIEPPGGYGVVGQIGSTAPFQIIDLVLAVPLSADGIRVGGLIGGGGADSEAYVAVAELDALADPNPPARPGFDLTGDGTIDLDDLHEYHAQPTDLTGDGVADERDRRYIERAVRWMERRDMLGVIWVTCPGVS